MTALEGLVIRKSTRSVRVRVGEEVLVCSIRGRLRGKGRGDGRLPVVVGDRVRVTPTSVGEAVLEEILERRSELRRARAPMGRAGSGRRRSRQHGVDPAKEIVVAANVDQVLSVQAALVPQPSWSLVDRVVISSVAEGVQPGICLTKWDQVADEPEVATDLEECLAVYRELGYPVFRVSGLEGLGLDVLLAWLAGKITVLSGHSGVGKSTLLNALLPGVDVATGRVSTMTGKGRHVTTAMSLFELPGGGCLIDTPGYREYGLLGIGPADVGRHYVEFRPHVGHCRFKDCLHVDEPGCAVLAAVDEGLISEFRYGNYLSILDALAE